MKRHSSLNTLVPCCIACAALIASADQPSGPWNVIADIQGKISKMSIISPHTLAGVEQEITIDVDKDGNPVRGEVKFAGGVKRELKPLEAVYYWDELKGASALWDYLAAHGRVTVYAPKTVPLPMEAFGKYTRILTEDNREFIGKLNALLSNPDWFILDIEGTSVNVYKAVVREVQQMK